MAISERGKRWTAYCGRAEDVLPGLRSNVALLLTDPPYGISYQSAFREAPLEVMKGDTIAGREDVYEVLGVAVSLFAHANQHLYVFGPWDLARVRSVFKSAELIWDKEQPGMGDLDNAWGRSYEPIQFATGHKASATRGDALMRKRRGSVLRCTPITGTRATRHQSEKPVPLLRELIEMSSRLGDRVLDPYMGSGSTGVAALLEGRRFTGIEVEEENFKTSVGRLRAAEACWFSQRSL